MSERRTSSWLVVCTVLAAATPTGGQAPGEVMFAPKWCPCRGTRLNLATGGLSNRSGTEQSVIQCPSLRRGLNAVKAPVNTALLPYTTWMDPPGGWIRANTRIEMPQVLDTPTVTPGGPRDVAFLKARIDEGADHLGILGKPWRAVSVSEVILRWPRTE